MNSDRAFWIVIVLIVSFLAFVVLSFALPHWLALILSVMIAFIGARL